MKVSVSISLDKRKQRKDGRFPIVFRLGANNRTTSIVSGYFVEEKHFDSKKKEIRKSCPDFSSSAQINNELSKERSAIIDKISKLKDQDGFDKLTITEIKDKVVFRHKSISLYAFIETLIDELKQMGKIGTARSYKSLLTAMKLYRGSAELFLHQVTSNFLRKYELWYMTPTPERAKEKSYNGLSVHLRALRAVLNKAIDRGLMTRENFAFENYKIKSQPTKKRAISQEAIHKIVQLQLNADDDLFHTRNIFLLSYFLYGMPYVDMARLKLENIVDGRVQYKRAKTHRSYNIKVPDIMQPIVDDYSEGKDKGDYLLPIVKRTDVEGSYRDIEWARARYNTKLRELAQVVGIEENLTSYVSRHSFASAMNNLEIPLTAISAMMGHGSITTTQVYLASLSKETMDQYNEALVNSLSS